jgi:hypothetical protein
VIAPSAAFAGALATVEEVGPVLGSAPIRIWDPVRKRGRPMGVTSGVVSAVIPISGTFAIDTMIRSTFPFGDVFCCSATLDR